MYFTPEEVPGFTINLYEVQYAELTARIFELPDADIKFSPGQTVEIRGLSSKAGVKLNGRTGTVVGPDFKSPATRLIIKFPSLPADKSRKVSINSSNHFIEI